MNATIIVLIAALALLFIGMVYFALYLNKHGINGTEILTDVDTGITYAQAIATAMAPFLPNTADATIALVLKVASGAVQRAEATYKATIAANVGAPDTRPVEARSLITSVLAYKGVSITPDIDKLINAIVPVLVLALPKTHEAVAA